MFWIFEGRSAGGRGGGENPLPNRFRLKKIIIGPNHFPGEYHKPQGEHSLESTIVFGAALRKCHCMAKTVIMFLNNIAVPKARNFSRMLTLTGTITPHSGDIRSEIEGE